VIGYNQIVGILSRFGQSGNGKLNKGMHFEKRIFGRLTDFLQSVPDH
jgi:hypothetical protein